jgi:hypothetical protein
MAERNIVGAHRMSRADKRALASEVAEQAEKADGEDMTFYPASIIRYLASDEFGLVNIYGWEESVPIPTDLVRKVLKNDLQFLGQAISVRVGKHWTGREQVVDAKTWMQGSRAQKEVLVTKTAV